MPPSQRLWVRKIPGDSTSIITPVANLLLTNACLSLEQPKGTLGRGVLELSRQDGTPRIAISSFIRSVCEQDRLDIELEAGVSYTLASLGPFSVDVIGHYTVSRPAPDYPSGPTFESSRPLENGERSLKDVESSATDQGALRAMHVAPVIQGAITASSKGPTVKVATGKVADITDSAAALDSNTVGGANQAVPVEATLGGQVAGVLVERKGNGCDSGDGKDKVRSSGVGRGTEQGIGAGKAKGGPKAAKGSSAAVENTGTSDVMKPTAGTVALSSTKRRSQDLREVAPASASIIPSVKARDEEETAGEQPIAGPLAPAKPHKGSAKAKSNKQVSLERPALCFTPRNLLLLDVIARNEGRLPSRVEFRRAWKQLQNDTKEFKAYKDLAAQRKNQGLLQGKLDPVRSEDGKD